MAIAHRTYARALFEAAQDAGRVGAVRADLAELVRALDEVPELGALLDNPEVEGTAKAGVLERVLGESDELVRNFLRLVAEKGRGGEVRDIAEEFDTLVTAEEGILDVELTTAQELSDDEFEEILARIERQAGRKVQASRTVDPDLIGGLVLQAGSMRLDASVRGRLDRLRTELATARS
jgi:F-type H+-transporting ATPase subunit delta